MKAANLYQTVTDKILAKLEEGVVPWERNWNFLDLHPRNLVTGKNYRGANVFLLAFAGFSSPYWIGFAQAEELAVKEAKRQGVDVEEYKVRSRKMWRNAETKVRIRGVKKGEKGTHVLAPMVCDGRELETDLEAKRVFFRAVSVFNVEQCEGIGELPTEDRPQIDFTPIETAEKIMAGFPNPPTIVEALTPNPKYTPASDTITMPPRGDFHSVADFYGALFHEGAHATGHPSRLDRGLVGPTQHEKYSREELVAEFGAAFLCAASGITHVIDQGAGSSASYIQGWAAAIQADSKLIVDAARLAAKAADHILGEESVAQLDQVA